MKDILAKGEASVRGIFEELCFLKRRNKEKDILAKGEASVRGIFAGLCSVKRRY
jgi:hypothetical protein